MRKFIRCVSPQSINPKICMIITEIRKFLQNTAQLCLETALKVVFVYKFESENNMLYFVTRMYVFADFRSF